jgi:alanyl-tRNA synthetase
VEAAQLRSIFQNYFVENGHTLVPSASLIPHDPSLLFTVAGMVPFKPYFTEEEVAPYKRAVSIQKCFRAADIDIIGTTLRHLTFFEMMGNFSFGDYFKEGAIKYAWGLVTEGFGLDPERLWVTVHTSDDQAEELWRDMIGVRPERIQRLDEDNFWGMGDTGPCGPCSEIFFDKGPAFGEEGGPAFGGEDRYMEFWNLVFMQFERGPGGTMTELPKKNIDTGSGFERTLSILNGVESVFFTDLFAPLLETASRALNVALGHDDETDVAIRRIAEHGRAMTMLVSDGVLPANEGRGYVLRRIIRRAILAARRAGSEAPLAASLVDATIEKMGGAYPLLVKDRDLIVSVLEREEAGFARTLRTGLSLLESARAQVTTSGQDVFPGDVAFKLHDTHGFPIELTEEIVGESGLSVDRVTFDAAMKDQPRRRRPLPRPRRAARGDRVRGPRHHALQHRDDRPGAAQGRGRRQRALPRFLAVLRRVRGPGGRHGHHRHRDRALRGPRHAERRRRAVRAPWATDGRRGARAGGRRHDRPDSPRVHAPQPHRDAPAALGAARRARRPRTPAGLVRGTGPAALRLLARGRTERRGGGRDPHVRQYRRRRQRGRRDHSDHQAGGADDGRRGVLRRQVR